MTPTYPGYEARGLLRFASAQSLVSSVGRFKTPRLVRRQFFYPYRVDRYFFEVPRFVDTRPPNKPSVHNMKLYDDFLQVFVRRAYSPERHGRRLADSRRPSNDSATRGIAIIAPGLNGGYSGLSVVGMARSLSRAGWHVAVVAYRDTGTHPTSAKRTYSGWGAEDLEYVVNAIEQNKHHWFGDQDSPANLPEEPHISLVGLSLGANIVLQHLIHFARGDHPIAAAVAFSPPMDFGPTVEKWSAGLKGYAISKRANYRAAKLTERKLKATSAGSRESVDGYRRVRRMVDADHYVTSATNGYQSAAEYWARATTVDRLGEIETPTLIVTAYDDPLIGRTSYPDPDRLAGSKVTMYTPLHGGHTGFISRGCDGEIWSEEITRRFLGDYASSSASSWPPTFT